MYLLKATSEKEKKKGIKNEDMENIVVTETNTGDIANLFRQTNNEGNTTYTDTELHELLGFVENMDNATTANDCESPCFLLSGSAPKNCATSTNARISIANRELRSAISTPFSYDAFACASGIPRSSHT